MPRYQVQHAYTSRRDGVTLGPWAEGDETELDVEVADWVNRDSPDTLKPVAESPEPKRPASRGRR